MVLFLNFDGVLHPNAVQFDKKGRACLTVPRHRLFESTNVLTAVIANFSGLHLVLNTWWTYVVGFDESLRCLPKPLSSLVDGAILQHASFCPTLPHRIDLASEAAGNCAEQVVILDHSDARYPKHILPITLLLEPQIGLADPRAAQTLLRFLSRAAE